MTPTCFDAAGRGGETWLGNLFDFVSSAQSGHHPRGEAYAISKHLCESDILTHAKCTADHTNFVIVSQRFRQISHSISEIPGMFGDAHMLP